MQTVTVMREVPPELLAQRRRIGADRWDEVWDEVWHLVPSPNLEHQAVEGELYSWLRSHWASKPGRRVLCRVNVSRPRLRKWDSDYRSPDIVLITPERAHILSDTHLAGGPDVAIEIRSPGDESHQKIAFYARVGTREIWIVDRDSRAIEIHTPRDGVVVRNEAHADGWTVSALGIEMKAVERRLAIRLSGDPSSQALLP